MEANYIQRLRLTFSKAGPTRYISHLDLARTLERALNRARIPVAYTQGYNRRPRLQMATALPLGYTSECELADIWLAEEMEPGQVRCRLMAKMAPGIDIQAVVEVSLSEPALQTLAAESTYKVTLLEPVETADMQGRLDELLALESCIRKRRGKAYDLRPRIIDLCLDKSADEATTIVMRLCLTPEQTGRPDEVLLALGMDPLAARVHRTELVLADSE